MKIPKYIEFHNETNYVLCRFLKAAEPAEGCAILIGQKKTSTTDKKIFWKVTHIWNCRNVWGQPESQLIDQKIKVFSNQKNIHLIGLLSDGGVHSHVSHLYELIDLIESKKSNSTFIHAFTDGRDVDPKSGINHIKKLISYLKNKNTELASICGRYFAMTEIKDGKE